MKFLIALLLPLSGPVLQAWLAILMVRRRVAKDFPLFFAYTIFAVLAELLKFAVRRNFHVYLALFYVTQPIYALLGFLAIAEVFYNVFKSFYRIWWFQFLLPGMGVLMVGFSVLIAVLRPPIGANRFVATVFVFEIIVRCLQLAVFFLIFGLAQFYDLFWRQYSFGIASGFGIAAFGILTTVVARSVFGTRYASTLQYLPSVTYLIAVLIWLAAFFRPLPPDPLSDVRPLLTPDLLRELYERYRRFR